MILSGFWATKLSVFQIVKHCWLLPFSRLWHLWFDTKDSTNAMIVTTWKALQCSEFIETFVKAGNYDENTLDIKVVEKGLVLLPDC